MEALTKYIESYANRPLATDDTGQTITYGEAAELGAGICKNLGLEKQLVFLLCSNTNLTIATYLYLLANDHAVLLLDQGIDENLLASLSELYLPDSIIRPDDSEMQVEMRVHLGERPLHEDLGILLSTSGSTGSPKLTRFTLNNIMSNAEAIAQYLNIDQQERPFCHLPLHYSFGFSIVNSHLIKGAHLQLTTSSIMERDFWDRFRDSKATSFSGVPFHFEMLKRLRFEQQDLPTLRYLTQAGGKLSSDLIAEFADLVTKDNRKFFVMYGQTEAGPRITYLPSEHTVDHPDSIGKAIPGVRLELLDIDGNPINEPDTEGELVCYSPAIMMGYAQKAADLSLGDKLSGRLATGDLAKFDQMGLYRITGRMNRFVKLQGNRVNLDDVEAFLKKNNYRAACVGVDNMLYVVLEGDCDLEEVKATIIHSLKFPPRCLSISTINTLPRSEQGKIRYGVLLSKVNED